MYSNNTTEVFGNMSYDSAHQISGNNMMVVNDTLQMFNETMAGDPLLPQTSASQEVVIFCSLLFIVIMVIGISGNLLVVVSVMCNRKMRTSMTNLLITNLAIADLIIMVFNIPDSYLFMRNSGWTLGQAECKILRYILVVAIYGSVLTLLALSVERYIAIIHPIKAHILCNKRRLVVVLGCIWPFSCVAALPPIFFNTVQPDPRTNVPYCQIVFPNHPIVYPAFRYVEAIMFYFLPLSLQVLLYCCISKHLFMGTDRLYRRVHVRDLNGASVERFSEALLARRGVVKMLILSVVVFFASYSPQYVLLVYNTFWPISFHDKWAYHALTMILLNLNSAANPILYSIFSQNFRQCFSQFACVACTRTDTGKLRQRPTSNSMPGSPKLWRHVSMATASSNV